MAVFLPAAQLPFVSFLSIQTDWAPSDKEVHERDVRGLMHYLLQYILRWCMYISSVDPNCRSRILHLYKCHYTTASWCVGWAFQMWLVRTLVRSQRTALLLPAIQFPYSQTYQTARFQPISSHLALARHVLSQALSDASAISGLRCVTVSFPMNRKQLWN